jgi:DeoR family transcriptional regulator, fructose operon transcriptional repressor
MQAEARQRRIEEHLIKVEFASLEELAAQVDASVSTVRRDLDALETQGHIRRTHGGARLVNPRSDEYAFAARDAHQAQEKDLIGRACAELIVPNQTVIIDAGTTCFHVARHLEPKTPHIITNSLPVAHHFSGAHKLEIVVSGGVIYPRLGVLVGPLAVATFRQIQADVAVMSCGGVTPEGITNSHALLIDIQRAMMQAARRIILCIDHTKFGRQSISRLGELGAIDCLVSNHRPPDELLNALEQVGTEVIVAEPDGGKVILPGKERPPRKREKAERPAPSTEPAEEQSSFSAPQSDPAEDDKFLD